MKTMNGVRILFALAALAAVQIDAVKTKKTKKVQPVSAEQKNEAGDVLDEVRNDLEDATNEAARQITNVTIAKNKIRKAVVDGTMTQDAAAVMIADYDGAIATIKKDLMEKADQAMAIADETEEQASYMSQFIGGAKSLGAGILAPFKAGYGYSEQEKNLARAVIAELEALKKSETDQAVIQKLDDEIYQQQLISGDAMGTRQKLLIGAAMVAAGVAGYALSGYFGGSGVIIPQEGSNQLPPITPPVAQESVMQQVEVKIKKEPIVGTTPFGTMRKGAEASIKSFPEDIKYGKEKIVEGVKDLGDIGLQAGKIVLSGPVNTGPTVYEGFGPDEQSSGLPFAQSIATAAEEQSSKPMVDVYEGAEEGQSYFDRLKGWWKGPQEAVVPVQEVPAQILEDERTTWTQKDAENLAGVVRNESVPSVPESIAAPVAPEVSIAPAVAAASIGLAPKTEAAAKKESTFEQEQRLAKERRDQKKADMKAKNEAKVAEYKAKQAAKQQ